MGHQENRALNLLGLLSASMETWEKIDVGSRSSQALLPLKKGSSGALVSAGAWLSGPVPLMLRLASLVPGRPGRVAASCCVRGSCWFSLYPLWLGADRQILGARLASSAGDRSCRERKKTKELALPWIRSQRAVFFYREGEERRCHAAAGWRWCLPRHQTQTLKRGWVRSYAPRIGADEVLAHRRYA